MIRALGLALLVAVLPARADDLKPSKNFGPYVPSPQSVVADMLRYAEVGPQDFLIDLGSGDGRIVLTAAKVFGARGFGVEIKEDLVKRANEAARLEGIADRVRFLQQDLFKTDLRQATVVTMYLLPDTVQLLRDKFLAELRPGARVVAHDYGLNGWIPDRFVQMDLEDKVKISGVTTTLIYVYVVPAQVAGRWNAQLPPAVTRQPAKLVLHQQISRIGGSVTLDGREIELEEPKLRGDKISFRIPGRSGEFTGQVRGGAIDGLFELNGAKQPWSAAIGG